MRRSAKYLGTVLVLVLGGTLLAQPADQDKTGTADSSQVRVYAREIGEAFRVIQQLQLQARKEKDVIKLSCVNDKLIQAKALRNVFDDARVRYEAASTEVDQNTQLDASKEAWNGIKSLKAQAQACAGEVQFEGDTKSGYTGPTVPDDPNDDMFPDQPEPPGYASPYD
jgi:hypothetical protein